PFYLSAAMSPQINLFAQPSLKLYFAGMVKHGKFEGSLPSATTHLPCTNCFPKDLQKYATLVQGQPKLSEPVCAPSQGRLLG
ncbi:UNVERIFIED_CONTAM: hypothetical protein NY603_29305, partial [Bacteroidetes bacterium 56_B9]